MIKYKYSFLALVLFGLIGFIVCCDLAIAPPAAAQITPTPPPPEPTPTPEPTPFPTTSSSTTSIDITTTTSVDSSTTSSISAPSTTTTEEDGSCSFYLDATSKTFPYTISTGHIKVTANSQLCAWSCMTTSTWITITKGLSNTYGDGEVEFIVAENTLPSARTATLTVAMQKFLVTQQGAPAPLSTTTTTASMSTSSVKPTTSISVSTTTTAPFCPIRNILGEQPENILLLTEFRNKVLLNSSAGKHYVLRYYQHALELRQIVQQNPSIRARAAAFIQSIIPAISLMLQKKSLELSPDVIGEARRLCDQVRAEASPALQEVIDKLKRDLSDRAFLGKLGIYISETER